MSVIFIITMIMIMIITSCIIIIKKVRKSKCNEQSFLPLGLCAPYHCFGHSHKMCSVSLVPKLCAKVPQRAAESLQRHTEVFVFKRNRKYQLMIILYFFQWHNLFSKVRFYQLLSGRQEL